MSTMRISKGVREGGQFAPDQHAEPLVSLASGTPATPVKFPETNRRIRGHNFYPPKAITAKIPPLYSQEEVPLAEQKVHLHYFASSAANWYVTEYDPATGNAFGYADPTGQGGEWGTFHLPELERFSRGYMSVERDCYFSQDTAGKIIPDEC